MTTFWERMTGRLPVTIACLTLAGTAAVWAHPHYGSDDAHAIDAKIRITETEIRFSLTISLTYAGQIVSFVPELAGRVSKDEERQLRDSLQAYFKEANPVTVDGVRVRPIVATMELVEVNPVFNRMGELPPDVRFELSYPLVGKPQQVSIVWENFPRSPKRERMGMVPYEDLSIPLRAFDERTILTLTVAEPEYVWHAASSPGYKPLPKPADRTPARVPVPVLSAILCACGLVGLLSLSASRVRRAYAVPVVALVVCAAVSAGFARHVGVVHVEAPWNKPPPLPTAQEAVEIYEALQRNIYRAFDYDSASDVYDTLAESVDGDLLEDIYDEVYQSLILRDQGGAVAHVRSVDVMEAELVSAGVEDGTGAVMFHVRSRWRVKGAVSHWGHVHSRLNEYAAIHAVAQRGDRWKITGLEILSQERVKTDEDDPPDFAEVRTDSAR